MKDMIQRGRERVARLPKWIFLMLAAFFTSQLLGFAMSLRHNGEGVAMPAVLLGLAAGIVLSWLLAEQYSRLRQSRWLSRVLAPQSKGKTVPFPALWLGCVVLWLPYFLAFYPGIACYDFPYQVVQYFSQAGYSTHHPLLHTLLMCGLIDLGDRLFGSQNAGVALYTFLQMVAVAATLAYTLWKVQRLRIPRWMFWGMAAFFCLLPVFPLLAISATKDVLFACFALLTVVAGLPLTRKEHSLRDALAFTGFAVGAGLLRNNAVYGYLAVLAVLCLQCLIHRRKTANSPPPPPEVWCGRSWRRSRRLWC